MPEAPANGRVPASKMIVLFDFSGTMCSLSNIDEPLPGVRKLVENLGKADIKMAVVTGSPSSEAMGFLTANGMARFFRTVVGKDVNVTHSERLRIAVQSFGGTKTGRPIRDPAVFVIDDDLSRLSIAGALGYKFIAVCTGNTKREQFEQHVYKPHAIFDDLSDTKKVIGALLKGSSKEPMPKAKSLA